MSKNWTDTEFITAVAESTSIRQVLLALGLAPQGGNYRTVHANVKRLNLDTSHWTGQASNAGRTFGPRRSLDEYLTNDGPAIKSFSLKRKLIAAGLREDRCADCGLGREWQGRPLCLELHHNDSNPRNNSLDNLIILCPNCHSQTKGHRNSKAGLIFSGPIRM